MFRDRSFNICLLVSTAWHLVCMFAVSVEVLPEVPMISTFAEIYFLGPILEKTIFEMLMEDNPKNAETAYMQRHLIPKLVHERSALDELDKSGTGKSKDHGRIEVKTKRRTFTTSLKKILRGSKRIPRYSFSRRMPVKYQDELSRIIGPAASRKIVYKPAFPKIRKRVETKDLSFMAEFELEVTPGGRVTNVEPIISTGYSDLDVLGMRYLRRWSFEPLSDGKDKGNDRGRIRLNFQMH